MENKIDEKHVLHVVKKIVMKNYRDLSSYIGNARFHQRQLNFNLNLNASQTETQTQIKI